MTDDNRRANLAAEIRRGRRAMATAELSLQAGLTEDAVARAYYAAFHHVRALLLSRGLQARTHEGTHNLFFTEFCEAGLVARAMAGELSHLQRFRELADYNVQGDFDEAEAAQEVERARRIMEATLERLRLDDWLDPPVGDEDLDGAA